MLPAATSRRAGFALRLEQGRGRLVLDQRRIAGLFTVEHLALTLAEVPSRLDLTQGVDRFRHQRAQLEQIVFTFEDADLTSIVRPAAAAAGLAGVDVRLVDGDIVCTGDLPGEAGAPGVPFLARARLEPAGVGQERTLLFSVYECRVFGAARRDPLSVAAALLGAAGLGAALVGPTCALIDPLEPILAETFAELGWKLPAREEVRLLEARAEIDRVRLVAGRPEPSRGGLRPVVGSESLAAAARYRRFLADYEAKTHYAALEAQLLSPHPEVRARARQAYERQLEVHPDHPFVVGRVLQLWAGDPATAGEAQALARGHLQRYPDHPDALVALAVAFQVQEQPAAAAEAWRRLARAAEAQGDVVEAAQALVAVAAALAESDPQGAIEALERALTLRRRMPGALESLAALQARVGDWNAALRTRERLLAAETDPLRRREILLQMGRLALDVAHDPDAAVAWLERALEALPDDVEVLRDMARAHLAGDRWLPAARALDRAATMQQQRGDLRGAAESLVRLGDLWHRLPDGGAATAALRYRQALLLQPGLPIALLGLAEVAAAEGDPRRARTHLEDLLRVAPERLGPDLDVIDVHLRLARLHSTVGADPVLAVSHYQQALAGDATQVEAAVEALVGLHRAAGREDDVARVLEVAAARAADPTRRTAHLLELAALLRTRLADPERAAAVLAEAARSTPGHPQVLGAQADLQRARGDAAGLAETLRQLAERVQSPAELAPIYVERAELLLRRLNRVDDALGVYTLALGCDPGNLAALEGLCDVYRERDRLPELAALLERWAAGEPDAERAVGLWLELARLAAGPLKRADAAVAAYGRARRLRPRDSEVLRGLGDLHFAAGRHAAALDEYTALLAVYEREGYDEPAAGFLVRLAETQAELDRLPEAMATLARALEHDPEPLPLYEKAQGLFLRRGDMAGLADLFQLGLTRARRPETRLFLARRAGRLLWRELRRPAEALPWLDEALRLAPDDEDLERLRVEALAAAGEWTRLDERLAVRLERAPPAERPALLARRAELALAHLGRPAEGLELAAQSLDADPTNEVALRLLAEHAPIHGDWARTRRAYGVLVARGGNDATPADVLRLALAELQSDEVEAAHGRLLALKRAGFAAPELLPALADACLRLPDAPSLAELLEARLGLFEGTSAARDLFLRRAGALLSGDAALHDAAVRCWQALLEQRPQDAGARAALAVLQPLAEPARTPLPGTASQRPPTGPPLAGRAVADDQDEDPRAAPRRQAAALAEMAGVAPNGDAAATHWLALAELQRDALADPDAAIPSFRAVLDATAPPDPRWLAAEEALEELHGARAEWASLILLYDRRLTAGVGDPAELRMLKASTLRTLGDLPGAIAVAEAALAEGGERERELLVALLEQAGRPTDAARVLLGGPEVLDPTEDANTHWRAADLLAATAPAEALDHYAEAADLLDDAGLADARLALARSAGTPAQLHAALRHRAAVHGRSGPEANRRARLFFEAATLAAEALADPQVARADLEAALVSVPDHVDALQMLANVLESLEAWDDAGAALTRQIEAALPGPFRGRLRLRLALLHADRRADPASARAAADLALADLGDTPEAALAQALHHRLEVAAVRR